jgi:hypothetical protein
VAALSNLVPNLVDAAKLVDATGKAVPLAEILMQDCALLEDMGWMQGSDSDGMDFLTRTGIPTPTWRKLNTGVQPSKGSTARVKFTCGHLEAVSNVDILLAQKYGENVIREIEDRAQIQGMQHEAQRALLYEKESSNPERITGLASYYESLSAENAKNIVDAGGTGSDNTSIFLVTHGLDGFFGMYPKGSSAGLQVSAKKEPIVIADAVGIGGATYEGYQSRFKWALGCGLADWRNCARICNIDYSNLMTGSSAADLVKFLTRAVNMVKQPGKTVLYMRREVLSALDEQGRASVSTGGGITYGVVEGKRIVSWRGFPIKVVDAIKIDEARIT